jgi:hypothetical protein
VVEKSRASVDKRDSFFLGQRKMIEIASSRGKSVTSRIC